MKLLTIGEVLWQDKAQVTWHSGGDRNRRRFHMMAKLKNTANHVVNHFSALFNNQSVLQDNYFMGLVS